MLLGNGRQTLAWPICGFAWGLSTTYKWNKLAAEPTNMASLPCQWMRLATIPMSCSIGGAPLLNKMETLPKLSDFIAFLSTSYLTDASAPFNLGNMLRAAGRTVEAEFRIKSCYSRESGIRLELGRIWLPNKSRGRWKAAIQCLRKASAGSARPTPMRCSILALFRPQPTSEYRRGRGVLAARSLVSDGQSEWASRARRSLKFCEIALVTDNSQSGSDQAA